MTSELKSEVELMPAILHLTLEWARMRSKDPSTKVASCIYDMSTGGMFFGYNGFPVGFADDPAIWNNRDPEKGVTKYDLVIHAEHNAIIRALKAGADLSMCVLVNTLIPCPKCMRDVVVANKIKRVIYHYDNYNSQSKRDKEMVFTLARMAGITLEQFTEH